MSAYGGKWRIALYLNDRMEILCSTVDIREEDGVREVVKMLTGPFDTPEDVLAMIIELLDHAEWSGEQLRLPSTMDQN